MERIQKALVWTVALSELGHVFCCVLPTVASVMSLLAGLGIISMMPAGLMEFHEFIHGYEIPMIIGSASVLLLGWILHIISIRIDCHNTGCCHEPCKPVKRKTSRTLKIATALFVVNIAIYAAVHVPMQNGVFTQNQSETHEEH